MARTHQSLCARLAVAAAWAFLLPLTVLAQVPTFEQPQEETAPAPAFPDPFDLVDGWQQELRTDAGLDTEKLRAWNAHLAEQRKTASQEERNELDRLIANLRLLSQSVASATASDENAPQDADTLKELLALVDLHRTRMRERNAAVTQLRLDKELAVDVQIRLNQARQSYISSGNDSPQRAVLGWRWLRLWSRQVLVDKDLELLESKYRTLDATVESQKTLLATPPDKLIYDEAGVQYWTRRLEDLAEHSRIDFADEVGGDLSMGELTSAARARADHLAYQVAERALQFTQFQLGLREVRPSSGQALTRIEEWSTEIQTLVDNRRERLLASIEASSVEATVSGEFVQRELESIRALSEQLNRIATGSEQFELIERQFNLAGGFSVSNLGDTWTVLGDRFTAFSDNVLNRTLFNLNDSPVTGGGILRMLVIIGIAYLVSWILGRLLKRLERRKNISAAAAYTFNRVLHYTLILLGFLIAISSIGIDLTKFALFASAIGIGLGFGLQAIISNFVSGLIILFERSLKIGDFVELESGVRGRVNEINVRGTIITTNDNIDILVPNSEFVNGKVTNWTLRDVVRRLRIRFGVAYGSDKELVKKAGLEAAASLPFTMNDDPARSTQVWLVGFGDSSLDFDLVVWISGDAVSSPSSVDAAYKWAIETALKKYCIEIPFPQQDLHVRSYFGLTGNAAISAVAGEAVSEPASTSPPPQLSSQERRELQANDAVAETLRSIEEFKAEKEQGNETGEENPSGGSDSAASTTRTTDTRD